MAHPRESELLVTLPEAGATPLRAALARTDLRSDAARDLLDAAFDAVAFPRLDAARPVVPLPSELTPPQRTIAEILSHRGPLHTHAAIPRAGWSRRRWWGLDKPSVLERPHTFAHAGKVLTQPLWRAIALRDDGPLLVAALPVAERLEAFGELVLSAYELSFRHNVFPPAALAALRDEGRDWAPRYADWLLDVLAHDSPDARPAPEAIRWPLFVTLVRSGIPIEARWEALFPAGPDVYVDVLAELAKVPLLRAAAERLLPPVAPPEAAAPAEASAEKAAPKRAVRGKKKQKKKKKRLKKPGK